MKIQELIDSFTDAQYLQEGLGSFYSSMMIVTLLSFILGQIYIKFGTSLSNRKAFAGNFVLLGLTTLLIITVVKSSLALSLGLVGALSIVRFRSAIKEPEELAYLFLTISLGLGLGAGQKYITIMAFIFISIILVVRGLLTRSNKEQNLFLTISSDFINKVNLEEILKLLEDCASLVTLRRIDRSDSHTEVVLYVRFNNLAELTDAQQKLTELDKNIKVSFIADRGIFN